MARRDFPKLRQRLLHDRTSSQIMRTLGRYPHVDIARVPYYFAPQPGRGADRASGRRRPVGSPA